MARMKAFVKANRFLFDSFRSYKKFSTLSEKAFDIYVAILISLILVLPAAYFANIKVKDFINDFQSLNNIVITAVSILAGFNMASIAVITSSQSDAVNSLKITMSVTDPKTSRFTILVIFFTWAITIQLAIVLVGLLLHFSSQFFITDSFQTQVTPDWMWGILFLWLAVVIHSIFISIRNIKMLFLFVSKGLQDMK